MFSCSRVLVPGYTVYTGTRYSVQYTKVPVPVVLNVLMLCTSTVFMSNTVWRDGGMWRRGGVGVRTEDLGRIILVYIVARGSWVLSYSYMK